MYDYIKGTLIFKNLDTAVVENNGIGYKFLINSRTSALLGEINEEVKVYTKLIHKEDTMYLAGFKQKEDRAIFDILTSVSGIGTKVAMVLLDEFSELYHAEETHLPSVRHNLWMKSVWHDVPPEV